MSTPQPIGTRVPSIGSMLVALHAWRRRRDEIRRGLADLESCGDDDLSRMAKDVQLTPAALRQMARCRSDAANLLLRRMAALGLNAEALGRMEPAVLRDLQRLCSLCATKKRCMKELARDPADAVWREHCPNAGTLAALQDDTGARAG